MISNIPPEITIASFSIISALTGYIWHVQANQIIEIKKIQSARPCSLIHLKIAKIQTDIEWIKQKFR